MEAVLEKNIVPEPDTVIKERCVKRKRNSDGVYICMYVHQH